MKNGSCLQERFEFLCLFPRYGTCSNLKARFFASSPSPVIAGSSLDLVVSRHLGHHYDTSSSIEEIARKGPGKIIIT